MGVLEQPEFGTRADGPVSHAPAGTESEDHHQAATYHVGGAVGVNTVAMPADTRLHGPIFWGVVVGIAQAATPLALWWLDASAVYALGLAVIAAVYIGFAVADGRWMVLAVESGVASGFILIAAAAITASPWLLVIGLAGHGLKDLWQHRTRFVNNTRWWPPFCLVVDAVVSSIIAVEIVAGANFHG